MKKTIFLLFLLSLLIGNSCSNIEENKQLHSLEEVVISARLLNRIDSLDVHYSTVYNVSDNATIRRQPADEFTEAEQGYIDEADMEGFAIGAAVGLGIGGSLGTALLSPVGGAIAGTASAVAVGFAYAEVWSNNEANRIREERQNMSADELFKLDTYNPINDFRNTELLFPSNIYCANVGFAHNYVLSKIYYEDPELFFDLSNEQIIQKTFELLYEEVGIDDEDIYNMAFTNINSTYEQYQRFSSGLFQDELITRYFNGISGLSKAARFSYTQDFMQIIDDEFGDNEYTLRINGSISTHFYSSLFWNINVPEVYQRYYIQFNASTNSFSSLIYPNISDIHQLQTSGNMPALIVPYLRDSTIASLFVFDELGGFENLTYSDPIEESLISYDGVNYHLRVPTDSTIFIQDNEYNKSYYFPIGSYTFERFNSGYVVFANNY